ncbi:MAG: hypothetical protein COC05_02445 [Gammaproteobacteria bacterium]|nr:MAG: hypothetical protein COC05_02445 [Gammaproteobacteria bacterium]
MFQLDLGTVNFGKVSSGNISIAMRASGTLSLHDPRNRASELTVQNLSQLQVSAKHSANTAAGEMIRDTTFKFDSKTNTVSFSNSLTTRSNLPDHPIISLTAGTNAQGQPALIGKMTQDAVKGTLGSHIFANEKITIEIEITADIAEQVTQPVVVPITEEISTAHLVAAARQSPQSGIQPRDVVDGVFIVLGIGALLLSAPATLTAASIMVGARVLAPTVSRRVAVMIGLGAGEAVLAQPERSGLLKD